MISGLAWLLVGGSAILVVVGICRIADKTLGREVPPPRADRRDERDANDRDGAA